MPHRRLHEEADRLACELFARLDIDGDGSLSIKEMSQALAALGLSESQQGDQIERIMKKRPMDRAAFRKYCRKRLLHLHDLFQQIDTSGNQEIDEDDVGRALRRVGLDADHAKVRRLISMVDRNGDRRLSFNEFYSALLILPSTSVVDLFDHWDRASLCDLGETSSMLPHIQALPPHPLSAFIAGGIAGIVSRTMTAPLDRLKIILQADLSPLSSRASLLGGFRRIYKEGGLPGLFRGNFANCVKVAPENGFKMWTFDRLGGFDTTEEHSAVKQFLIGATAGTISQTMVYPLETIKTHFALSRAGQFRSLSHCANSIWNQHGPRGFYRGLTAATMGIIPYAGVDLSLFAFFRKSWEIHYPHHNPSTLQLLGFGAMSSTCGQLVAYPFQLARTRLQSQSMPGKPIIYKSFVDCFVKTVKADGVPGLYRGLQPNFLKALPSISISYAVYDLTYRQLEREHNNHR